MLSEIYGGTGAVSSWTKVVSSMSFSSFSVSAATSGVAAFTLPAGAILEGTIIKHSVSFGGGGITAYTLSLGVTGSLDKYSSAFDVLQAVSGTAFEMSENWVANIQYLVVATNT